MGSDNERSLRNVCKEHEKEITTRKGNKEDKKRKSEEKRHWHAQLGRGVFGSDGSNLVRPSDW